MTRLFQLEMHGSWKMHFEAEDSRGGEESGGINPLSSLSARLSLRSFSAFLCSSAILRLSSVLALKYLDRQLARASTLPPGNADIARDLWS